MLEHVLVEVELQIVPEAGKLHSGILLVHRSQQLEDSLWRLYSRHRGSWSSNRDIDRG